MNELLEILSDLHADIDFNNSEDLVDNRTLDSLDIIALIAEIDSEFDVSIPAEEIIPANFNSAKAMYALISRLSDEF